MKKKSKTKRNVLFYIPNKWIMVMKLTFYLVFFLNFSLMAVGYSQDEPISMNMKKATVEQIFKAISDQTNLLFFYNHEEMVGKIKLDVKYENEKVNQVLSEIGESLGFTYRFMERYVIITPVKQVSRDSIDLNVVIKGVVRDKTGEVLPGVTVLLKGTRIGVATNVKGEFELKLPERDSIILVFSFVGMVDKEVRYTGQKQVVVVLNEAVKSLDDVVVTGYTNVRKSSFTGNAVSVGREELLKVSKTNIIQALQTFDPSFRIRENNQWGSDPNALPEMYIRGQSGIGVMELDRNALSKSTLKNNPNLPVFVMDGFEVSVEKIYDMDPNRINSLTILKDAAATAMYGSRAANGVIVISTMAPNIGEIQVSYNFVGSVTIPDLRDYNLMNAAEKVAAEKDAGLYVPRNETIEDWREQIEMDQEYAAKQENVCRGVDTYWLSKPLQTAFNHKHSLYLEGGSETIRFGVDFLYNNQDGVMKGSLRDRFGAGFALDYRLKQLQIRNYISYNVMKSKESPHGSFSNYTSKLPYDEYKDEDGKILKELRRWNNYVDVVNPLYEANVGNYTKENYVELIDDLSINLFIMKSLQLKGELSVTKKEMKYKDFIHPKSRRNSTEQSLEHALTGELRLKDSELINFNSNILLTYNQLINKHNINFAAGMNVRTESMEEVSSYYRGFPAGNLDSPSYAQEIVEKPIFTDNKTRLLGLLAFFNYSYDDIYLLDVSCRTDGSSEFGANKRFAPFWAGGFGINIHNYKFVQEFGFVHLLKIRGSYGQTGKVNFPPYSAVPSFEMYIDKWYATGVGSSLMWYMGNPNLKWERTNKFDVGFELGLYNNLFYLKASYYMEKTKDLITDVTTPSSSGFISYKSNLGEVENKGFEINLRTDVIRREDLYLSLWANMAHNQNKIVKISDALKAYNKRIDDYYKKNRNDRSKSFTKYEEGASLNAKYGMRSLGIDPVTGKELFVYKDGKTVSFDWSAEEMSDIGNELPWGQGALGVNFKYKGFTLFASFLYEFGGDFYNYTLVNNVENADVFGSNVDKRVTQERWHQPGDVTKLKDVADRNVTTMPTSRFVQKLNVMSLSSLTIGYEFDPHWLQKLKLNLLRVEVATNDLWRISSVKTERGLSYPFAQTVNFSLKLDF